MKKCQNCGMQLPDDARFCPSCGSSTLDVIDDNKVNVSESNIDWSDQLPVDDEDAIAYVDKIENIKNEIENIKSELGYGSIISKLVNYRELKKSVMKHPEVQDEMKRQELILINELNNTKDITYPTAGLKFGRFLSKFVAIVIVIIAILSFFVGGFIPCIIILLISGLFFNLTSNITSKITENESNSNLKTKANRIAIVENNHLKFIS